MGLSVESGIPGAYRGPQVCRLAHISYRQLDYWARTGLLLPSIDPGRGSGYQRLYSRDDLVMAAAIRRLLELGVSIPRIRELAYAGAPGDPLSLREAVDRHRKRWTAALVGDPESGAGLWLDLGVIRKRLDDRENPPIRDEGSAA